MHRQSARDDLFFGIYAVCIPVGTTNTPGIIKKVANEDEDV
jgi:hypothetical protein